MATKAQQNILNLIQQGYILLVTEQTRSAMLYLPKTKQRAGDWCNPPYAMIQRMIDAGLVTKQDFKPGTLRFSRSGCTIYA